MRAVPEEVRALVPLPLRSQLHQFREAVPIEGLVVQVLEPERLSGVAGRPAPQGQELLVASVVLDARGSRPISVTRSSWQARDKQGKLYPLASLPGTDWLTDRVAQPGEEIKTWLAFVLPAGSGAAVQYRPTGHNIVHVWQESAS